MIYGIIITSISLLLDALLSSFIPFGASNSIFVIPMFTVISLIIIYPYYNNRWDYLKVCLLFGLIYDILFTNTLGLNITLFFVIGFIISLLDDTLSNTLFSIIIKMLIVIVLYDSLTYFILYFLDYMDYNIMSLVEKLYKSLLLNVIYITILYFSTNAIAKKLSIRKAN